MKTTLCTYGQAPYWNASETPAVIPQFRVGTLTPLGKIIKVTRGAYTQDATFHTVMYTCEQGRISEVDLLDCQPANGGDATLGKVLRWFYDGKFRTFIVDTIGFNPYEFRFVGGDMVSPVGVYLVGQSSAIWETIS